MSQKVVAVGMSGGVDSSVCAYLLKQQGYRVIGLFMKNWEEDTCTATQDFEDVVRVCEKLDIPYYSFNFAKEYKDRVFNSFLEDLKKGLTPNPDILCNREIKFDVFFKKAKQLGANFLATGHYAQISNYNLVKGKDSNKDQSYFLYTLKSHILKEVLFPIGHLLKDDVRKIAKKADLPVHNKKDSVGICFIGKRNFSNFLSKFIGYNPGNFENLKKQIIGKHQGCAYYTIGQRKGLKIGGEGEAWFVVDKDIKRNVVIIEQGSEHPSLFSNYLIADQITWVQNPPKFPFKGTAKIRYRQTDQECEITQIENEKLLITFKEPQRAITLGQSLVIYNKDICLGGGIIKEKGPSLFHLNKELQNTF
jgi:tRNA-uridine 2-sulfurtransferase